MIWIRVVVINQTEHPVLIGPGQIHSVLHLSIALNSFLFLFLIIKFIMFPRLNTVIQKLFFLAKGLKSNSKSS